MPRGRTWLIVAGVGVAGAASTLAWFLTGDGSDSRDIDGESIVMLGDSITEQGNWGELLPALPIVNAGRSGFTTAQLVPVAEEVARQQPATVFVLTGTNDIRDGHPPDWTADHLDDLLEAIEQESPSTSVIVQTVLPRSDRPAEARATSEAIRTTAASRGLRVLDLHASFDDGTGSLRAVETTDGVHLSTAGYQRWSALLTEFLERHS